MRKRSDGEVRVPIYGWLENGVLDQGDCPKRGKEPGSSEYYFHLRVWNEELTSRSTSIFQSLKTVPLPKHHQTFRHYANT